MYFAARSRRMQSQMCTMIAARLFRSFLALRWAGELERVPRFRKMDRNIWNKSTIIIINLIIKENFLAVQLCTKKMENTQICDLLQVRVAHKRQIDIHQTLELKRELEVDGLRRHHRMGGSGRRYFSRVRGL